jgi:MSHA pilin protein MshD
MVSVGLNKNLKNGQSGGFTLVELLFFLVVVAIGLGGLLKVFNDAVLNSVDLVLRVKAVEKTQAILDEILARKFDENTPTGGYPPCNSAGGASCAGITADSGYDDVGDYNGYSDNTDTGISLSVAVVNAGSELGVTNTNARRITVTTVMSDGSKVVLSAYKFNF